jgi:Protein of unknown function (DUF669)
VHTKRQSAEYKQEIYMPEVLDWGSMFAQAQAEGGRVDYEALPTGEYEVIVDNAEAKTTSNGKPMLKVLFKVVDPGPHQGRGVFNNITLSVDNPKAMSYFFENMKCMGLTMENWFGTNPQPTFEATAAALAGRALRLRLKVGTYNDRTTNAVDKMLPSKLVQAPGQPPQSFAAPPAPPQQTYAPAPPQQTYASAPAPQAPPQQQYAPAPQPQYAPAPEQQQYAPAPPQYAPAPAPVQEGTPLPRPF